MKVGSFGLSEPGESALGTRKAWIRECAVGSSVSSENPLLAVIVLTLNEERNLPECLESLRGLSAEKFVVDSGSMDRTTEIARRAGIQVLEHPFGNYAAQRNWAQDNLPTRTQWILHLDAGERLTPGLVGEINDLLADPPEGIEGFLICRRILFMGRWIKHGGQYPSYHLRLYRAGHGNCEERLYDQHFVVKGRTARLRHDFFDVVAPELRAWTVRHTRWADLERLEMTGASKAEGRVRPSLFGNPIERQRWRRMCLYHRAPLFARAFFYWGYRYFVRLGFLDGVEGLIYHSLQGFWYRFYIDALIYEASRTKGNEGTTA